jgi:hypothetical protein
LRARHLTCLAHQCAGFPPNPKAACLQVNAFCNTDDITWGTKNLDTKRDATEAKTLMKSGLVYNANQVGPW